VADLDTLRMRNREFIVRGRARDVANRVFDYSTSSVDNFLRIPPAERRPDLYRSQETIPDVHPNGYRGPGLNLRDSQLQEGYDPTLPNPPSHFVPPDAERRQQPSLPAGVPSSFRSGTGSPIVRRFDMATMPASASAAAGPAGFDRRPAELPPLPAERPRPAGPPAAAGSRSQTGAMTRPATLTTSGSARALPAASQRLPAASQRLPSASQRLPSATQRLPAASQRLPEPPQTRAAAIQPLPAASQTRPAALQALPAARQIRPAASQTRPAAPHGQPAAGARAAVAPPRRVIAPAPGAAATAPPAAGGPATKSSPRKGYRAQLLGSDK
jgi:hypothetical protein